MDVTRPTAKAVMGSLVLVSDGSEYASYTHGTGLPECCGVSSQVNFIGTCRCLILPALVPAGREMEQGSYPSDVLCEEVGWWSAA